MSERVLIIKESHLAYVITEWYERTVGEELARDYTQDGVDGAETIFELAKEMGYVSY